MKSRRYIIIALIAATAFWGFKQADEFFELSKNLEIFSSVYKEVNKSYVDDVKPGLLMKKSIDAMLSSLDPYTNFYSESEAEDAMIQRTGEYGGLGCSIIRRGEWIYINEIYSGYSADKAGLRIGDKLLEINGKNFKGKTFDECNEAMRGAAGSKVGLMVERNNRNLTFNLERMEIKIKNVPYYGLIDNQTGYIKLEHFREHAGNEVKDALLNLKSKGIKRVMLDLRDNGGGLLHEAVNVCNVFINGGELVVFTKGRLKEMYMEYKTLDKGTDVQIPLIVLVNHQSASASEIVCGTIQDLDRGVVLGRNTYGKGLVQGTKPLPYRTQMKITTSKYYIPSGRCIQLLDYSHRNPDGSAAQLPDSLRKNFTTRKGRIVKDGGGVKPDVEVNLNRKSNIAKALEDNFVIYDFATQYRDKHESIPDAKSFVLGKNDFEDFKNFLITANYAYETQTEKSFLALKKNAGTENYISEINTAIEEMDRSIKAAKLTDMDRNKEEILNLLKTEISRRYYNQEAIIEAPFSYDPDILRAVSIFNSAEYATILIN